MVQIGWLMCDEVWSIVLKDTVGRINPKIASSMQVHKKHYETVLSIANKTMTQNGRPWWYL